VPAEEMLVKTNYPAVLAPLAAGIGPPAAPSARWPPTRVIASAGLRRIR